MKKLNINPEKVMKNEELIVLRGGYDEDPTGVTCKNGTIVLGCVEIIQCDSQNAIEACESYPETTQASYSCHVRC